MLVIYPGPNVDDEAGRTPQDFPHLAVHLEPGRNTVSDAVGAVLLEAGLARLPTFSDPEPEPEPAPKAASKKKGRRADPEPDPEPMSSEEAPAPPLED